MACCVQINSSRNKIETIVVIFVIVFIMFILDWVIKLCMKRNFQWCIFIRNYYLYFDYSNKMMGFPQFAQFIFLIWQKKWMRISALRLACFPNTLAWVFVVENLYLSILLYWNHNKNTCERKTVDGYKRSTIL